ncbi:PI31 proteasome regulator N-terminal-domain-containing protein [Cytidiella melzeri]|nr:PI31 proteasome regulator N-terminal-domain-containing protein [Cytidiella melzeri]
MSNILDPSALLSKIPSLLPAEKQEFQSSHDGLAALVHSTMTALGFRLVGVEDNATTRTFENNVLPPEWNSHGPGSYTFRYKHEQSSFEFVLKVSKLGTRTMINAIAIETDKAESLDISTNDFTSPSFYPHNLSAADASPLVHGFISSNRVTDFVSQYQMVIVQKLIPGLRKDGYTEQVAESAPSRAVPGPSNPHPQPVPPPEAPDFSSPLQIPTRNPLEVGRRDLEPFPRNPFAPRPLFGGDDDGMLVGPTHPIFGPRSGTQGRGPWGGDGFLPPMGAPPGARFDPIGPGLGPHPGGPLPRFGGGGVGRGLPGGGNMRDPDHDEFMPPGPDDMFS